MTDMIQRIAQAIVETHVASAGLTPLPGEWEAWTNEARAVLAAIREPTSRMIDATASSDWPYSRETWMDMVDAALAERLA